MKHVFIFLFLLLCVCGHDTVPVSVTEGDSVTLYTDIKTIQQEEISWYFNGIRIAEISGDPNKTCTDVQCYNGTERFRGRLKLNNQTGSLTITNITNTDSGEYKLQINSSSDSHLQLFNLLICVSDVPERQKIKSVKEGDAVTLDPGVVKKTNYLMKWLFNDVRIAEINGDLSFICADVQCLYADVRFRDRLKLNHITASLTITNTRTTDSGLYYLLITTIRFNIIKSFIVNVTGYVDAASVSVMEGDSVTLYTDVKTNQQEEIRWYFNDIRIAQITEDLSFICADVQCTYSTERFRDRLKLDHQTGSLTITNITNTVSGLYELHIGSSRISIIKSFSVTVPTVSDSGLSSAAVAGIVALCVGVAAVVLLLVAAVVIYYRKHQAGQHNNVTDMVMHFSNQMEKDPDDDSCQ
uniref:Immunoglobulin domain-containing protein n=1 Tax=Cyprinus carpio carpio TaxID=630221 RepID=A0A9J8BD15_CYPCA